MQLYTVQLYNNNQNIMLHVECWICYENNVVRSFSLIDNKQLDKEIMDTVASRRGFVAVRRGLLRRMYLAWFCSQWNILA